jgi:hypothetical protein
MLHFLPGEMYHNSMSILFLTPAQSIMSRLVGFSSPQNYMVSPPNCFTIIPPPGRCFDLTPDSTQDCVSYAGTITGYVAGVDDTSELLDFMA